MASPPQEGPVSPLPATVKVVAAAMVAAENPDDKESLKAASKLQAELISRMGAHQLSNRPFHHKSWPINSEISFEAAEKLMPTVRVFYFKRYLQSEKMPSLLANVPYVCTGGDTYITTQSGRHHSSLEAAYTADPRLITPVQRRLSRNKCIASMANVYAKGGYHSAQTLFSEQDRFKAIVVSGAGPQFEAAYLDYLDFIIHKTGADSKRLPEYAHYGTLPNSAKEVTKAVQENRLASISQVTNLYLHTEGYTTAMQESVHLWLTAFNAMASVYDASLPRGSPNKGAKVYVKLTAIGTGFFADVAGTGVNIGDLLMPRIAKAVEAVLAARGAGAYPRVGAVEFPDFSYRQVYRPSTDPWVEVGGVKLLHRPRRDVLDFDDDVRARYIPAVLNPGDCFACVGNELGFGSVEAMIGNNTDIRLTQCYLWNERILEERNFVAVED